MPFSCRNVACWVLGVELANALTLANTEDVLLFSEQQRQALHQQQGFMVALDWCFPLMEHLIQRSSLNLRGHQDHQLMFDRFIIQARVLIQQLLFPLPPSDQRKHSHQMLGIIISWVTTDIHLEYLNDSNCLNFPQAYHLHSVAEQQPLCRDGGDLVHETMLPGKKALQTSVQRATEFHAGFVQLIQLPHHCVRTDSFGQFELTCCQESWMCFSFCSMDKWNTFNRTKVFSTRRNESYLVWLYWMGRVCPVWLAPWLCVRQWIAALQSLGREPAVLHDWGCNLTHTQTQTIRVTKTYGW